MVKFKVCLFIPCFYIFFLIQKFHVAFNELCLCIYIKKNKTKKNQKKIQDFQNFPKKREKFSKKKKIFGLGTLDFLLTFSKKDPFFFFQRFQDSLKSSFQNGTCGSLGQNFF